MKPCIQNVRQIFRNRYYLISYILLVILFWMLWYYFTDFDLLRGNYGENRLYIDSILSWINIIFFPLFLVAWFYRARTLGEFSKKDWAGFIGGIIGILISGTLCCGSSVLLIIGWSALTTLVSRYLPWHWFELKVISVIVMLIALWHLLSHLLVCKNSRIQKK